MTESEPAAPIAVVPAPMSTAQQHVLGVAIDAIEGLERGANYMFFSGRNLTVLGLLTTYFAYQLEGYNVDVRRDNVSKVITVFISLKSRNLRAENTIRIGEY